MTAHVFERNDPLVAHLPCLAPGFAPTVWDETRTFWLGGRDGHLMLSRCQACRFYLHPPVPMCRRCCSKNLRWELVSGTGTVFAFTVNHQRWEPGLEHPYVIAIVELAEQEGLRLTTNLVGIEPQQVKIGLTVQAAFVDLDGTFVPVFAPKASA